MLTAYFYHKTTGVPLTDPLVTVSVTLANMNNDTIVLDNATMSASSSFSGAYRNFYTIDREIDYMAYYSCSDSNYTTSVDKLYIPSAGVGGGGASINISGIQATIRNSGKSITDEIAKFKESIDIQFNDTNSHIDLVKTSISDKIDSIEIPEAILEEKEAKKAIKLITSVDKKLSSYIESEMKEKEEIGAITRELTRLELEEEKEMIEKKKKEEEERKMEEEEQKKEEKRIAELLNAEFDKLEEEDKIEKKKELEKELQETLKEAEDLKKELNSL